MEWGFLVPVMGYYRNAGSLFSFAHIAVHWHLTNHAMIFMNDNSFEYIVYKWRAFYLNRSVLRVISAAIKIT